MSCDDEWRKDLHEWLDNYWKTVSDPPRQVQSTRNQRNEVQVNEQLNFFVVNHTRNFRFLLSVLAQCFPYKERLFRDVCAKLLQEVQQDIGVPESTTIDHSSLADWVDHSRKWHLEKAAVDRLKHHEERIRQSSSLQVLLGHQDLPNIADSCYELEPLLTPREHRPLCEQQFPARWTLHEKARFLPMIKMPHMQKAPFAPKRLSDFIKSARQPITVSTDMYKRLTGFEERISKACSTRLFGSEPEDNYDLWDDLVNRPSSATEKYVERTSASDINHISPIESFHTKSDSDIVSFVDTAIISPRASSSTEHRVTSLSRSISPIQFSSPTSDFGAKLAHKVHHDIALKGQTPDITEPKREIRTSKQPSPTFSNHSFLQANFQNAQKRKWDSLQSEVDSAKRIVYSGLIDRGTSLRPKNARLNEDSYLVPSHCSVGKGSERDNNRFEYSTLARPIECNGSPRATSGKDAAIGSEYSFNHTGPLITPFSAQNNVSRFAALRKLSASKQTKQKGKAQGESSMFCEIMPRKYHFAEKQQLE